MSKLFRLSLRIALMGISLVVIAVFVSQIVHWNQDLPPQGITQNSYTWDHQFQSGGPFRLLRTYKKDATAADTGLHSFLIVSAATPNSFGVNGSTVTDASGQTVTVSFDKLHQELQLPISNRQYMMIKIVSFFGWLISMLLLLYCCFQLYLFSLVADRKDVFTERNMRILRQVGWIAFGYGVVLMLVHLFKGVLVQAVLGYSDFSTTALNDNSELFTWVLVGLLLLSVASAFRRGIYLKESQSLTI